MCDSPAGSGLITVGGWNCFIPLTHSISVHFSDASARVTSWWQLWKKLFFFLDTSLFSKELRAQETQAAKILSVSFTVDQHNIWTTWFGDQSTSQEFYPQWIQNPSTRKEVSFSLISSKESSHAWRSDAGIYPLHELHFRVYLLSLCHWL